MTEILAAAVAAFGAAVLAVTLTCVRFDKYMCEIIRQFEEIVQMVSDSRRT